MGERRENMSFIETELAEYLRLQRINRGHKLSGQGRIWRRKEKVATISATPIPYKEVHYPESVEEILFSQPSPLIESITAIPETEEKILLREKRRLARLSRGAPKIDRRESGFELTGRFPEDIRRAWSSV